MENDKQNKKSKGPVQWFSKVQNHEFGLFLLIFTVLSAIACYPILLYPTRHLGSLPMADKGTNLWNLWWVYYALFERGISPLRCDTIFIPWGCDLRYHTLSIVNGVLASPFTAWFGPVVSFNGLFVIWTAMTGCFAALWARQMGGDRWVAILLGILAAYGPYRWAHQIHLNLFSTPWLFLAFYLCERSLQKREIRYSAGIGLVWLLAFFSDWYYGLFVGLYLAIRSVLVVWQERNVECLRWAFLFTGLPAVFVGFLLFFYFYPSRALEGYVDPVAMKYSAFWSLDLMHFFIPIWLLPQYSVLQQNEEFYFHPGMVLMGLPLVFGWVKGNTIDCIRKRRVLGVTAGVFFLVSLGPVLMGNGRPVNVFGLPIFLPAGLFELIPGLTVIRVYARFVYIGLAAYLLLGLLGLQSWMERSTWQGRAPVLICIGLTLCMILETGWRFPEMFPEEPSPLIFPDSPKPVLELPFTPSQRGGLHLYHQTLHQQPIFVAEFSRLGNYRKRYLEAYPALDILNRAAKGESPMDDPKFNPATFREEYLRLEPLHMALAVTREDWNRAELIRERIQSLLSLAQK